MMESEKVWRKFMHDLSKHFRKTDVEKLIHYHDIPGSIAEDVTDGFQLVKCLSSEDKISKENISELYDALDIIGRKDLKKDLREFEANISPILEREKHLKGKTNQTLRPTQPEETWDETSSRNETKSCGDKYKMTTDPRGLCIIINNMFDEQPILSHKGSRLTKRSGSEVDKGSLENLFTWLKYKVQSYDNVSYKYLETLLTLHSDSDEKHDQYDSFVCCVLSHGYEKGFYCNDGQPMDFSRLRSFFQGDMCPELIGKPKLFFIQACQGDEKGGWGELAADGPPGSASRPTNQPDEFGLAEINQPIQLSADADFFLYVSAVPGTVSYRDRINGTWFIQEMDKVFKEYAEGSRLMDLCLELNSRISKKAEGMGNGRIAKMMSDFGMISLRKKLYFDPGMPYSGPYDLDH